MSRLAPDILLELTGNAPDAGIIVQTDPEGDGGGVCPEGEGACAAVRGDVTLPR